MGHELLAGIGSDGAVAIGAESTDPWNAAVLFGRANEFPEPLAEGMAGVVVAAFLGAEPTLAIGDLAGACQELEFGAAMFADAGLSFAEHVAVLALSTANDAVAALDVGSGCLEGGPALGTDSVDSWERPPLIPTVPRTESTHPSSEMGRTDVEGDGADFANAVVRLTMTTSHDVPFSIKGALWSGRLGRSTVRGARLMIAGAAV
jgi:hypothetical protein